MNRDKRNLLRALKENFGDPGTETLTGYIHLTVKEELGSFRAEVKSDFNKVYSEFDKVYSEFDKVHTEFGKVYTEFGKVHTEFAKVRSEVQTDISRLELGMAKMKGELDVRISDTKADLVRWMFVLFVTMMLAVIGLYFKK
jgi:hypothetical protein